MEILIDMRICKIFTPPAQKSTMVSPGWAISLTAATRFSNCSHFLCTLFFGRSPKTKIFRAFQIIQPTSLTFCGDIKNWIRIWNPQWRRQNWIKSNQANVQHPSTLFNKQTIAVSVLPSRGLTASGSLSQFNDNWFPAGWLSSCAFILTSWN